MTKKQLSIAQTLWSAWSDLLEINRKLPANGNVWRLEAEFGTRPIRNCICNWQSD